MPAQNLVYADTEGNIGYQAPGRIPVREPGRRHVAGAGLDRRVRLGTATIPFDELPSVYNPPRATS